MSELLSPPTATDGRLIGAKLTSIGAMLSALETASSLDVQEGVERILMDSTTAAVTAVPNLGFAMRAIALGARRELAGFYRSFNNVYLDITSRVDDDIIREELLKIIQNQEEFITEHQKYRPDISEMLQYRRGYTQQLRRFGSRVEQDATNISDQKTAAIAIRGLVLGVAPSNERDSASHYLRIALGK